MSAITKSGALALLLSLLTACHRIPNGAQMPGGLISYYDPHHNVICYRAVNFEGLSCVTGPGGIK